MKQIKFNNKEVDLLESWSEVSFRQFVDLAKYDSINSGVVSVILGIPEDEILGSKDTATYNYILNELNKWLIQGVGDMMEREERKLVFNQKAIEFGDVGECTVAQYEDCKILIERYREAEKKDKFKALLEYYPLICAVYLQPKSTGKKYNYDRAKQLSKQVEEMPAEIVIGCVNFFLLQLTMSRIGIVNNVPKASSVLKRWRQGWETFIRRLGFRLSLIVLRKAHSEKRIILKG